MALLTGTEIAGGFEPSLFHRLFRGRKSGNEINGLGEKRRRRPTPIYHDRRSLHPWRVVQEGFYLRVALRGFWRYVRQARAIDRERPRPIASPRSEDSPEGWSRRLKAAALELGADVAGVARLDPEWVFEGERLPQEPWIVVLGCRMDFDVLNESTRRNFSKSLTTIMETYNHGHHVAHRVADWIRERGWHATGHGSPMRTPVAMIPAAIAAGLGELGKHGSLIHRQLGSNVRLSYVLTDLPLVADGSDDFGGDEFCASCQLCTRECPPHAIVDQKQLVRGVARWYVDFDRCVPYFNDKFGCGICLAVCPWSRPGIAEKLTAKMAQRRERHSPSGENRP